MAAASARRPAELVVAMAAAVALLLSAAALPTARAVGLAVPVRDGSEIAALLLNTSVSTVLIMNDIRLEERHFQGIPLPIVLTRSVSLDGSRGSGRNGGVPTLDWNFVQQKVRRGGRREAERPPCLGLGSRPCCCPEPHGFPQDTFGHCAELGSRGVGCTYLGSTQRTCCMRKPFSRRQRGKGARGRQGRRGRGKTAGRGMDMERLNTGYPWDVFLFAPLAGTLA